MRIGQTLPVALALALATVGCVTTEKYEAALQESERVRADLDREQTQMRALEEQIKKMDDQTAALRDEAKLAQAEVQRLHESGGKDHSGVDGRLAELDHKIEELAAQNKTLQGQTHELKKRNASLEALVARSQSELKELSRAATAMGGPVSSSRPGVPAQGGPQAKQPGAPMAAPAQPGAPAGAAPAQMAKAQEAQGGPKAAPGAPGAPAAQPVPTQEDLGLVATIKHWLSTIWHWIF